MLCPRQNSCGGGVEEEEGADQNKASQSSWEGRLHINEKDLRTGNTHSFTRTLV